MYVAGVVDGVGRGVSLTRAVVCTVYIHVPVSLCIDSLTYGIAGHRHVAWVWGWARTGIQDSRYI